MALATRERSTGRRFVLASQKNRNQWRRRRAHRERRRRRWYKRRAARRRATVWWVREGRVVGGLGECACDRQLDAADACNDDKKRRAAQTADDWQLPGFDRHGCVRARRSVVVVVVAAAVTVSRSGCAPSGEFVSWPGRGGGGKWRRLLRYWENGVLKEKCVLMRWRLSGKKPTNPLPSPPAKPTQSHANSRLCDIVSYSLPSPWAPTWVLIFCPSSC